MSRDGERVETSRNSDSERTAFAKVTVDEVEQEYLVTDSRLGPEPVPFGFGNDSWVRVTGRREEGDELWEFNSPPETWANLCGRAGICLVQDGWIVDAVISKMN